MQKQKVVVLLVAVALLLVAIGIKIAKSPRPATASSSVIVPAFAAVAQEPAAAKKQAEEDAKFWAQKERVSSHVTIEHTKEEEDAAQKQQQSLLNTVRGAEVTPESHRR